MRKRRLSTAIIVATTAALALTGCGFGGGNASSGGQSGKDVTLSMLVPSYSAGTKARWEGVISKFEKANPGIKIALDVQSWENLDSVLSTKIQGKKAPDIYNGGPFAGHAGDGLLYKADEVISADKLADFQDAFVKNEQLDGTTYALPLIASARALFVNTDLLTQAGVAAPPKTWDELLTAATAVSKLGNGIAGYGMPLGSEEAQAEAAIWLWGGGGTFGDAKDLKINDNSNLAGAEQIKKMIDAGATQANPGSTQRSPLMEIFIQGKIGMQVGLPPTVGAIKKSNPNLKYQIVPIPTKDGSPLTLGVADQLMAFNNGDDAKKAAVKKFFDFFYTTDVYTEWVSGEGFLPTTKSGATALAKDEALKPFIKALPDAKFFPTVNPHWAGADAAMKALFGQIESKQASVVLDEVQAQATSK